MKKNTVNSVSNGFKFLACILSVFFLLLAVFDGFEEKEDVEYFGEYVTEAEINFVDFPESISRPTGVSKVNKSDRLPLIKFFDRIFRIFTLEIIYNIKSAFKLPQLFSSYNFNLVYSVCTNAP